jgi:hypothetical protein
MTTRLTCLLTLLLSLVALPATAQKKASKPKSAASAVRKTIKVRTLDEFLKAIGPNRVIEIQDVELHVSDVPAVRTGKYYRYSEEYDGLELVISGVQNLTILGLGPGKSHLVTRPLYGDVLVFDQCTNVTVEKLRAGHGPERGQCTGGVLNFINCKNVTVRACVLYGSGMQGLETSGVNGLKVSDTVIEDCTYHVMTLAGTRNAEFTNCQFRRNQEFDMVNLSDSKAIVFRRCTFEDNTSNGSPGVVEYSLFNTTNTTGVLLERCVLRRNRFAHFGTDRAALTMTMLTLEGNTFGVDDFLR